MSTAIALSASIFALAIVISMLVALLIKGIVATLSWHRKPPWTVAPPPATVASGETDTGRSDIAAITAAVYAVVGAHRIVHIERADRARTWTAEGRAAHHASHAITRHSTKPHR